MRNVLCIRRMGLDAIYIQGRKQTRESDVVRSQAYELGVGATSCGARSLTEDNVS